MRTDCDTCHRNDIRRGLQQKAVGSAKRPLCEPYKARFDAVRLDRGGGARGKQRATSHVEIGIKDEHDRFAFGGLGEIAIHCHNSGDAGRAPGHGVGHFIANADET